jgi:hypothetical protein
VIPATGHVTISGHGWGTGLYVLSGSNAQAIQNVPHTDLAVWQTWSPGPTPGVAGGTQSITGSNVTIRNLRINGNRGTYPNGNSNGHRDGTVTDPTSLASTPDARGPYTYGYWLAAIMLVGLDNVEIDHVWIYDAPAYSINLYTCTNVNVHGCRIEATSANIFGGSNTDGVHFNGGCSDGHVTDSWFKTGDDAIGINLDEGTGATGSRFTIRGCHFAGCLTGIRVLGKQTGVGKVNISQITGSVVGRGLEYGLETGTDDGVQRNDSVIWTDSQLAMTGPGAFVLIYGSGNSLDLSGIKLIQPPTNFPFISWDNSGGVHSIGRISVDVDVIRNSGGTGIVNLLTMSSGSLGTLDIRGWRIIDQTGSAYGVVPNLLSFSGTPTIGRLWVGNLDPQHITALTNDATRIGSKAGPGLAASGF